MCNVNCILFGARSLLDEDIRGRQVLEVGSRDVNGSLRSFIESRKPEKYVGVDIVEGPGVDVICGAEKLLDRFEEGSFDIVISTELLEHVRDWRIVISNIKRVCKAGGIILITTRSIGFPIHGYPHDYWRYELEDMEEIFSDCKIQALERDPSKGVLMKAVRPVNFEEKELPDYALYSVLANRRVKQIADKDLKNWHTIKLLVKGIAKNALLKVAGRLWRPV